MNKFINNINEAFPLWKELDDETKILSYIEFVLYLVKPTRWNVRLSRLISLDQDKLAKIQNVALELHKGLNIWKRLSQGTVESYINLPKTIDDRGKEITEKDEETGKEFKRLNKFKGRDLLYNSFNIHHIRIDDTQGKKINLFDEEVHFVKRKQNELLFAMFDDRFSTVYFLDILKHDDLYKYSKLLNIINSEGFPSPYQDFGYDAVGLKNGFTDNEFKKLLFSGGSMIFEAGGRHVIPLNMTTVSGFTDKVINHIYAPIKRQEFNITLPADFIYPNQMFSEFYQLNFQS